MHRTIRRGANRSTFALQAAAVAAIAAGHCATAFGSGFHLEPAIADPSILGAVASDDGQPEEPRAKATASVPAIAQSGTAAAEVHDLRDYGRADSFEFEFTLGPAFDFDGTTLGILDAGAHWFVADGVSFGAFVEGLVIDANDDDSWGFGIGLVARWHFIREDAYSVFIEGGAGFAGFSDQVPSGGTDYDFTPRAALGATYELKKGMRLVGKVGWFHISNAQTGPGNPGLDSISASIGLSFTLGM